MQLSCAFSRFTKVQSTELKGGKSCKLEDVGGTIKGENPEMRLPHCSVTIISFQFGNSWYLHVCNNSTRSSDQRGTTCQHTPWFFLHLLWSSAIFCDLLWSSVKSVKSVNSDNSPSWIGSALLSWAHCHQDLKPHRVLYRCLKVAKLAQDRSEWTVEKIKIVRFVIKQVFWK